MLDVCAILVRCMSHDVVTTDTVNFLGISIVGQTNEDGSGGGIFVGSVMKG